MDVLSLLITTNVGISLRTCEQWLNGKKYTLGYQPKRKLPSTVTLKQILDTKPPNLYALRYGEIDDICVSVTIETEHGKVTTKNVPRAATGPDFKKMFIGSKGIYGEILEATFRISPLPQKRQKMKLVWELEKQKTEFLKKLWASGARPAVLQEARGRELVLVLEGHPEIIGAEIKFLKKACLETGMKWKNS